MKGRIAVTPRSMSEGGHPDLDDLAAHGYEIVFPSPGRQPSETELLTHVPGCIGYLAGVEPVSRRVIEASPGLRVISRNGVGVDNIDLAAADECGVAVERALGANTRGVAELALTLMLCGLRHVVWSSRALAAGEWKRRKGREMEGRTLGIVGCGAIGRTFAGLCSGLGMEVVGYDPFIADPQVIAPSIRLVALETLFAEADVISLHCPPTERPLIDADALARMRDGIVLVNTARAELIDEAALVSALDAGKVSAFATDVFRNEPPAASPLLAHKNAILTPHAGGYTEESVDRATRIAVDNLLKRLESD